MEKGHVNLFAQIGRAVAKCIGTFAVNELQPRDMAETLATMEQGHHLRVKIAEGHAPERVQFSREFVLHPEPKPAAVAAAPMPGLKAVKSAKKGK